MTMSSRIAKMKIVIAGRVGVGKGVVVDDNATREITCEDSYAFVVFFL